MQNSTTPAARQARFEKLIASQMAPAGDLRRRLTYTAYWLAWPLTLLECALMAALSLVHYGLWRIVFSRAWFPESARRRPGRMVKPLLDVDNALGAMRTVERIGRESGGGVFWLSGTLLGLERLGKPLPHDTDMDAGICIEDPRYADFIRALAASSQIPVIEPQYISLKARIQNPDLHVVPGGIIRYKAFARNDAAPDRPPVKADIFLHFPYCGGQVHGSRNSLWWNSPFQVVRRAYGGGEFSVPGNAHLHLTENYGDYRTEVKEFENSIDCPNAMNIYSWMSLAYLLVRQHVMLRLGRVDRAARVNRRIAATLWKGICPLFLQRRRPHFGS